MGDPFVSVIIAVLRAAEPLAALLQVLHPTTQVEVVVAHGDASDPALETVRRRWPGVQWVDGLRGRGCQMNAGAERTTGQWLLFLHAAARLGDGWLDEFRRAAVDGADGGGRRLIRWNAQSGEGSTLVDRYRGKRFNSPNYLCVDTKPDPAPEHRTAPPGGHP